MSTGICKSPDSRYWRAVYKAALSGIGMSTLRRMSLLRTSQYSTPGHREPSSPLNPFPSVSSSRMHCTMRWWGLNGFLGSRLWKSCRPYRHWRN